MDTELLKTFLEVQRTRHFGKAAENLYLTQSAVSFRIRQLEQQLGVNLFVRYRNNIQLTAAGERLLPHAQTMLSALHLARQDVALSLQQARQISLAASNSIWDAFLHPVFLAVQSQKPELFWRTDTLNRELITRHLLEHQIDLAVVFDPPKTDDICVEKLADVTLLAVSNPIIDNANTSASQPYCYIDWGSHFDIQHARHSYEQTPIILRSSSAQLVVNWLLTTSGYAYLPSTMVAEHLKTGRLVACNGAPPITLALYVAHLSDNQFNQELRSVVAHLKEQVAKAF